MHIKDEETGKMAADPGVKTAYTSQAFKWKTLSNDPATGKRAQVMQLANPAGNQTKDEPFTIKLALTVDVSDEPVLAQPLSSNQQMVAPISMLSIGSHEIKLQENQQMIATRRVESDITELLESQQIPLKNPCSGIASITSLVGRFPQFDFFEVDGKSYMWIKEDITFAKDAQGRPVFILPTDDLRLKFVIFESPESPI